MTQILSRYIEKGIFEALKASPVVFLSGARQTGKSTLVQGILDKIGQGGLPAVYVTFDRPVEMAGAAAAPEAFLTRHRNTLVIDEVQMVPALFRALKVVVDEMRLKNKGSAKGKFLLTGSANIMALPKLSDSLVGRMSLLTLYPFSAAEVFQGEGNALERLMKMDFSGMTDRGIEPLEAITRATFPEISGIEDRDRRIWIDGYLTTILQRDVRMIAEIEKIYILPHLLRLLANRAGNLINDSDLGRDAGLNSVTTKFYRNILKMMFLNFEVQPWYRNIGKRLVKSPKGFLIDSLLLCHLLDRNIEDLSINRPEIFGQVLENFVAAELTKLISFTDTKLNLLHFRTSDGKEVDFVLERPDGSIFGIEIKKSESVTSADFGSLRVLKDLTKNEFLGGVVLYTGKDVVPFGKGLWAVPLYMLWQ